jgi:hypothetical protein
MFGLSLTQIKWIVIGLLFAAVASAAVYIVHSYNDALYEAQQATLRADKEKKRADTLQSDFAIAERDYHEADRLGIEAQQRAAASDRSRQQLEQALRALQNSPGADRDWLRGPVPDATRRLRRGSAGCPEDPAVSCPDGKPPADAGTPDAGRNRGGADQGGLRVERLTAVGQ